MLNLFRNINHNLVKTKGVQHLSKIKSRYNFEKVKKSRTFAASK